MNAFNAVVGKAQLMGYLFIWTDPAQLIGYPKWSFMAQLIGYLSKFVGTKIFSSKSCTISPIA